MADINKIIEEMKKSPNGSNYPIEDLLALQRTLSSGKYNFPSKDTIPSEDTIQREVDAFNKMQEEIIKMAQFVPARTNVKIFINDETLSYPQYATNGASGMDLCAAIPQESEIIIKPMERVLIPTGVFVELPLGYEFQIRPRSGMSYKIGLMAILGTIDSDYRGEIKVIAINLSDKPITVKRGERVAQMVLQKVDFVNWIPQKSLEDLTNTVRGDGGFGSTGK